LWLVINKKVYDVSKFHEQHPGGGEVLVDVGGKDATQDFEDVGHSDEAQKMLKDYYIGDLVIGDSSVSSTLTKTNTTTTTSTSADATTTTSTSGDTTTNQAAVPASSDEVKKEEEKSEL